MQQTGWLLVGVGCSLALSCVVFSTKFLCSWSGQPILWEGCRSKKSAVVRPGCWSQQALLAFLALIARFLLRFRCRHSGRDQPASGIKPTSSPPLLPPPSPPPPHHPFPFTGTRARFWKPTRLSRKGLIAYASSTDCVGPIASSVADVAALLGAVAGEDKAGDSTALQQPVPDYTAMLAEVSVCCCNTCKEYEFY